MVALVLRTVLVFSIYSSTRLDYEDDVYDYMMYVFILYNNI